MTKACDEHIYPRSTLVEVGDLGPDNSCFANAFTDLNKVAGVGRPRGVYDDKEAWLAKPLQGIVVENRKMCLGNTELLEKTSAKLSLPELDDEG